MEARKAVGSRRRPPAHALAMTLDHHRVEPKRVAAEHCVYALTDYREVDRTIALARCQVR